MWADDVEEDEAEERLRQGAGASSARRPLSYAAATTAAAAASSSAAGGWAGRAETAERGWEQGQGSPSDGAGELADEARDDWHEGLEVQRGASRQRLNIQHGFLKEIVSGCGWPRRGSCPRRPGVPAALDPQEGLGHAVPSCSTSPAHGAGRPAALPSPSPCPRLSLSTPPLPAGAQPAGPRCVRKGVAGGARPGG